MAWEDSNEMFFAELEVDATDIGDKEGNRRSNKKLRAGRGAVGRTTVVGMRDRDTGEANAHFVESAAKETLHESAADNKTQDTIVYEKR